ncbi:hypothetical protein [Streptomyces erythrochromogenes]|uniref:hypothetical protein n=1 Tax=Streptomyces erythrochromogenes TaxID=285574 RepID=UPI0036833AF9
MGCATAARRLVTFTQEFVFSERVTVLLLATRAWPLLAVCVADVARDPEEEQGLRDRLRAGVRDNPGWRQGSSSNFTGGLVAATLTR